MTTAEMIKMINSSLTTNGERQAFELGRTVAINQMLECVNTLANKKEITVNG